MSRQTSSLRVTTNLNVTGASVVNGGTLTLPTSTTTLVGTDTSDTLTNKVLTTPQISTITNAGAVLTLPTATTTLVGHNTTDTLTNKTLTAPVISTIINSGATLTLPTTATTLVGTDTTDTLTNKTIASPTLTNAGATLTLPTTATTIVGTDTANTLTNKTITGTTNAVDATTLRAGATWAIPLGGAAPATNQILSYNGTNAVWTTPVENNSTGTVTTTDATATPIETIATATDTVYVIKSLIAAKRTDALGETAGYEITGTFKNIGGVVTQVGGVDKLEFEDVAGWDVTFSISGTSVLIQGTGAVGSTISWKTSTTINSV